VAITAALSIVGLSAQNDLTEHESWNAEQDHKNTLFEVDRCSRHSCLHAFEIFNPS